jgi:zinc protease
MGVAYALGNLERYGLGLNYYRQYADLVRSVTREQILETARKYLDPDRLAIAIAGSLA